MTEPLIEVLPIEQAATPDPNNINRHTARGGALVVNSLQRRGAFRSIASAGKDADTPVVYAGNLTLEKAVEAGFTEVVNVHVTGNQLVNVVRDDVAPGSPEAIALGLEDNESAAKSYNPDIDILAALAAGDDAILSALRKEDRVFDGMLNDMLQEVYSRKIESPIYTPKGEKPSIKNLFDDTRTKELIAEIDVSDLPEDEKDFLRIAAQRHTALNFKMIAEYYAHSQPSTQRLMENNALVIIDFGKAIENGYVILSQEIQEIQENER